MRCAYQNVIWTI